MTRYDEPTLLAPGGSRGATDSQNGPARPCSAEPRAVADTLARRVLDVGLAAGMLVAAAPLILVAAALVKLTSRGPAFYAQVRVGLNGRLFTLRKLRSMAHDCEARTGPRWSSGANDPRVTRLGRLLRRTHVDELPQLWHVVCGEMSLVGPRPERPEFVSRLASVLPRYSERMAVRPGLTGLAQIQLPPDTDLESVRCKLGCDLHYINSRTLGLDARILFGTVVHVLGLPFTVSRALFALPRIEAHRTTPVRAAAATAVG
jgi:lipopolysaccharide/colanic/teichoic acid biosynthesis glycosyltransferase